MTSPSDHYGMYGASPDPSYGSSHMPLMRPAGVHQIIDTQIDSAFNHIKLAHEEFMRYRRSVAEAGGQPYAGVADHIRDISSTLAELTSALTQESVKGAAKDFIISQGQARNGMFGPKSLLEVAQDKKRLEYVTSRTRLYR